MKTRMTTGTLLLLTVLNTITLTAPAQNSPFKHESVRLDLSFGFAGLVNSDFGFGRNDQALALDIQPDGKIVAAGVASIPGNGDDFAVIRYNNDDGSPDATFGTNGTVTTNFFGGNDRATGVLIRPDGKIIAGGDAFNTNTGNTDLALAAYNADGSLDSSFGINGKVTTDFGLNDLGNALILQPDGKLILAGSVLDSKLSKDFALVRYNPDGSLDSGFGVGGKVITDFFKSSDEVSSIVLRSDGSILAAGFADGGSSGRDFAVARYDSHGILDTTFGVGGKATVDFFGGVDEAKSIAFQPDGRIVLAGSAFNGTTLADFALARFNADGILDTSFGDQGKVTTDFARNLDEARKLIALSDGSIIAAGRTFGSGSGSDFALVSYSSEGKLDRSFGSQGKLTTDFRAGNDQAFGMAVDSEGRVILAGGAQISSQDFALARYLLQHAARLDANDKP